MTTSAELLELVGELRGASRMGRARILAHAVKVLRALPSSERRALSIEVAKAVAPDLLPQLESGTGNLTPGQISQFVTLVQQLDSEQLAAVAAAIAAGELDDPAVRHLAAQVTSTTLDALAPPEGDAHLLPDADVVVESEEHDASPAQVAEPGPDVATIPAPTPTPEPSPEPSPVPSSAPEPAIVPPVTHVPSPAPVVVSFDEPITSPFDDVADHATRPIAADARSRRNEVVAVADGWRRRRLLMALAREDLIADEEALTLVATLARSTDRSWVIGLLLDRGLVTLPAASALLDERVAARLQRRSA